MKKMPLTFKKGQNDMDYWFLTDKMADFQIKIKTTELQKDLKALDKAEHISSQYQHAKEILFRKSFDKYLTRGNFEATLIRKQGFQKTTKHTHLLDNKLSEPIPIHKLIYSGGEVDVDKVVCLHLLTVQYIAVNSCFEKRNLKLFAKRSSPNVLGSSPLPFYILEIIHKLDTELRPELQEDQEVILLVNCEIEKLVKSILDVLAIVSPQKLQKIREIVHDQRKIQETMIKPKIFNFLAQLKECPALVNMASYRVELAYYQAFPGIYPNVLTISRIKVKDRLRKLELIQTEIKKAIGKYTEDEIEGSECWAMMHRKFCSCKRVMSQPSVSSGEAIALLNDEGQEFALVTGSGCRLPTRSSIFCPSFAAIIKSAPKQGTYKITEETSGLLLNQKTKAIMRSEQTQAKVLSSLLHKVNNSHRILIGKKSAENKSWGEAKEKVGNKKMPINKIMEDVFSKESMISFASRTENEELRLLFQPCCRGGLGIGTFILEPTRSKFNKQLNVNVKSPWKNQDKIQNSDIMKQQDSIMSTAFIKQDIFTSETRNKMKQFLLSDNPGHKP